MSASRVTLAFSNAMGMSLPGLAFKRSVRTNLLDRQYFESYIDSSALIRAGVPAAIASDLGLMGDRHRVGIRGKYSF
jgi:hypothetical protein